jgi:hypothetical protein
LADALRDPFFIYGARGAIHAARLRDPPSTRGCAIHAARCGAIHAARAARSR